MVQTNLKNKRIAKNSTLMYLRMFIVMGINLFTVRYVLKALGQEDYGIFNVVAGIISMFQSIGMILATSTQRFLSFAIGRKDNKKIQCIYSASINIYAILGLVILILSETIGLWFFNNYLIFPEHKIVDANILYHLSVFTLIITLFHSPFISAIIAYEDLGKYAKISIIDCSLRFFVAIILFIFPTNKLVVYGIMLLFIPLIILNIYIWCIRKYDECRYLFYFDKVIYKKILSFSGWTLFSSFASIGINQIITIIINIFFGPIANAARAVSMQISNAVTSFSSSFIVSVRPPMIKYYAEEKYDELNNIFNFSNKFLFYGMLVICLPIILEMDTILFLWLEIDDVQTIIFSKLAVIYTLILALNNPLSIIVQATGDIKEYSIKVEAVTLLCPFLSLILFYNGFPAYYAVVSMIFSISLAHLVRIVCVKRKYKNFSIYDYMFNFLLKAILITAFVAILMLFIHNSIACRYSRLILVAFFNIISIGLLVWLLGLTKTEKLIIKKGIFNIKKKSYA